MKVSGFSIPEKVVAQRGTNGRRGGHVAWTGDGAGAEKSWATVVVSSLIWAIKVENWQESAELAKGEAESAEELASEGAEPANGGQRRSRQVGRPKTAHPQRTWRDRREDLGVLIEEAYVLTMSTMFGGQDMVAG